MARAVGPGVEGGGRRGRARPRRGSCSRSCRSKGVLKTAKPWRKDRAPPGTTGCGRGPRARPGRGPGAGPRGAGRRRSPFPTSPRRGPAGETSARSAELRVGDAAAPLGLGEHVGEVVLDRNARHGGVVSPGGRLREPLGGLPRGKRLLGAALPLEDRGCRPVGGGSAPGVLPGGRGCRAEGLPDPPARRAAPRAARCTAGRPSPGPLHLPKALRRASATLGGTKLPDLPADTSPPA